MKISMKISEFLASFAKKASPAGDKKSENEAPKAQEPSLEQSLSIIISKAYSENSKLGPNSALVSLPMTCLEELCKTLIHEDYETHRALIIELRRAMDQQSLNAQDEIDLTNITLPQLLWIVELGNTWRNLPKIAAALKTPEIMKPNASEWTQLTLPLQVMGARLIKLLNDVNIAKGPIPSFDPLVEPLLALLPAVEIRETKKATGLNELVTMALYADALEGILPFLKKHVLTNSDKGDAKLEAAPNGKAISTKGLTQDDFIHAVQKTRWGNILELEEIKALFDLVKGFGKFSPATLSLEQYFRGMAWLCDPECLFTEDVPPVQTSIDFYHTLAQIEDNACNFKDLFLGATTRKEAEKQQASLVFRLCGFGVSATQMTGCCFGRSLILTKPPESSIGGHTHTPLYRYDMLKNRIEPIDKSRERARRRDQHLRTERAFRALSIQLMSEFIFKPPMLAEEAFQKVRIYDFLLSSKITDTITFFGNRNMTRLVSEYVGYSARNARSLDDKAPEAPATVPAQPPESTKGAGSLGATESAGTFLRMKK